ncbi:MAG: biotin transporter BioY, partial [Paracoccaceae bacterium]|nr:biotin transporter BioY [Paracoccaceae bacterium]MDP5332767.1 biotin transporter BioY [Paracoccaceae bacterium]MDP5351943.1 biotin transporter BioY [Paracoccaceae bacterium]MDP5368215.1 biotin transporter BioY [Paracoccaceae bacterium]
MEKTVTLIALFAALIAALGLVPQFALMSGVPITAQSLGIMLCGTILGAKRGALAVLVFLLLLAMGFPLLSGGRGGLGVFQGPSVGFLIGFPVAAYVVGLITSWRLLPLIWAALAGA